MEKQFYFLDGSMYRDGDDPKVMVFQVAALRSQDLDALADAIQIRRNVLMADRLRAQGFTVRTQHLLPNGETVYFSRLSIRPAGQPLIGGEWFTLAEAQRLLDTAANLPPVEAFERMLAKIEQVPPEPYTESMAIADTREARRQLQARAEETEMSADGFALEYAATSFMDLAR